MSMKCGIIRIPTDVKEKYYKCTNVGQFNPQRTKLVFKVNFSARTSHSTRREMALI
jgi:hypothetical protein